MPHRQLLAAALAAFAIGILMQPVRAATGDAAVCHTPTEVRLTYEAHVPGLMTSVYRGTDASAFIKALIAEIGPPPPDLGLERTVAVGTYIAGGHVEIAFYEDVAGMECWFFDFSGDTSNLQSVFKTMGRIGA